MLLLFISKYFFCIISFLLCLCVYEHTPFPCGSCEMDIVAFFLTFVFYLLGGVAVAWYSYRRDRDEHQLQLLLADNDNALVAQNTARSSREAFNAWRTRQRGMLSPGHQMTGG